MSDAPSQQVRYEELPELYHTWKWRVLIAYCVFKLVDKVSCR